MAGMFFKYGPRFFLIEWDFSMVVAKALNLLLSFCRSRAGVNGMDSLRDSFKAFEDTLILCISVRHSGGFRHDNFVRHSD